MKMDTYWPRGREPLASLELRVGGRQILSTEYVQLQLAGNDTEDDSKLSFSHAHL